MQISFFGYGKTTRAIARRLGGGFRFYDDRTQKEWTDADGNIILPSNSFDCDKSSIEILTPSMKPDSTLLSKARNPVSEYDLFLAPEKIPALSDSGDVDLQKLSALRPQLSALHRPITVWISGTNGKTTTTQMLTHILKKNGAVSGGNIGTPLADMDNSAPVWVLETSSYTLHHTHFAAPDIYLLLPVTPDHIDWHGTAEKYEEAKLDPVSRMKEGQLALIPSGLNVPETNAWVVEYDGNEFLEKFFCIDASRLRYRSAFLQDALLAMAVGRTLFDAADYDLMNSFGLDRHRQEEIRDDRSRLWVNDSKATNLDAAIQAVNAYSQHKIHLIAGGDDKGVDMRPLIEHISELDVKLYTIGSNREKLAELAKQHDLNAYICRDLADAVKKIDKNLKKGETALLSPAASSLDQFSSYVERGDKFIQFIKNLPKN